MAVFNAFRLANADVSVSDEHVRVNIAMDSGVGAKNGLELGVDKEVVRVNVLFHQTFDLEESWQEVPFVLG
jgi:hypothetical protein